MGNCCCICWSSRRENVVDLRKDPAHCPVQCSDTEIQVAPGADNAEFVADLLPPVQCTEPSDPKAARGALLADFLNTEDCHARCLGGLVG